MSHLRTRLFALTCAAAVVASTSGVATATAVTAPSAANAAVRAATPGFDRLQATGTPTGRAIATFAGVPTTAQVEGLRDLGLVVQPMKKLPLALVAGSDAELATAATSGIARDVYPDETLQYLDTASTDTMSSTPAAAAALRKKGFTGKGVTVGVVDSGCDGTHPDLADHITHNVTLVSAEYVNQAPNESNTLVVPIDQGPYNNTDLGSGHGTHVAGIIAADGTTGPDHLGVAPDAELACFAIGAVITTTAVVTAYDYMLRQPKMLGIDVINNSWGNSFRQYDPADPVNVATKAVSAKGAVVVFSAGNSGYEFGEASGSPFNQAPWVISVAAGTVADRQRGNFSSNGLEFDNGRNVPIGKDGHTVLRGDRIGNTRPDIMAPGVKISSSCDSTGTVIGPCPPGENTSASGTSMSAPHVAGAAAVIRQANRKLDWGQVQRAITATASPVVDADGERLPSWTVGHGHINLDKAVKLVSAKKWKKKLKKAGKRADRRILREDEWAVLRADLWQEAAPTLTLGGSYTRTHEVTVSRKADALKIALVYPTPAIVANAAHYVATVTDATGTVVGETTTDLGYATGIAHVLVEGVKPGTYTVEVTSDYSLSDPDTIDSDSINGRVVFLQAAQLRRR